MGDPFPFVGQIVKYVNTKAEHCAALVVRIDPENSRLVSLQVWDAWGACEFCRDVPQDEQQSPLRWYTIRSDE